MAAHSTACCGQPLTMDSFVGFCGSCGEECCDACGSVEGDFDGNMYRCAACVALEADQ